MSPWPVKHGARFTPEYELWQRILQRCRNVTSKDYPRYGGRGITVCNKWLDFTAFAADLKSIGPRMPNTSLDRIDNSKGYEPGNVRWATPQEQARNRRRFTVIRSPLGVMPLVDYAKVIGLTKGAAHLRLKRGKLEGCEICRS